LGDLVEPLHDPLVVDNRHLSLVDERIEVVLASGPRRECVERGRVRDPLGKEKLEEYIAYRELREKQVMDCFEKKGRISKEELY